MKENTKQAVVGAVLFLAFLLMAGTVFKCMYRTADDRDMNAKSVKVINIGGYSYYQWDDRYSAPTPETIRRCFEESKLK